MPNPKRIEIALNFGLRLNIKGMFA